MSQDMIAPAVIQELDGKWCDGAGEEIKNQQVLDTLPLEPYVFHGADLKKLDADLKLISEGKLDVALLDSYDYDQHQWETSKGKMIGELFDRIDAGEVVE